MKRSSIGFVGVIALAASTAAFAQSGGDAPAFVPRHTQVPVLITREIRIGGIGASQEKKVEFEVAQDVVVNGKVIAKAGDLVEGHYTSSANVSVHMFGAKQSEDVALDLDDVVNFCGDTINVQFEHTFSGGMRFGLTGPHATDVVMGKGTVLVARTDRVIRRVCADRTSEVAKALPANAIVGDDASASASAR